MPSQSEIQQEITHRILDGILFGTVPWRKPWRNDANCGAPTNVLSQKPYAGINPLLLDLVAMKRGYLSKWWGTYQQWASLGAQVKKRPFDVEPGRWGTNIVLWKQIEKTPKDENSKPETFPLLRYFTVFNIDQVEGDVVDHLRAGIDEVPEPASIDFEPAQQVADATGAKIVCGGDRAFYVRPVGDFPKHDGGDYIRMPQKKQFPLEQDYWSVLMHELCHWSEIRLNWTGSYEMGELIAEIGSAFLATQIGIPGNTDLSNHSAYVESWLKILQEDERAVMRAASQASKATEFILSFSRQHSTSELQTA